MSKLIVKVQYRRSHIDGVSQGSNQPLITEIYCAESFSRIDAFKEHPRAEFRMRDGDKGLVIHEYHVNGKDRTGKEQIADCPASRIWVETLTGTRIETLQPQPESSPPKA